MMYMVSYAIQIQSRLALIIVQPYLIRVLNTLLSRGSLCNRVTRYLVLHFTEISRKFPHFRHISVILVRNRENNGNVWKYSMVFA